MLLREESAFARASPVFPAAPATTIPHPNLGTPSQAYFGYHDAVGDVEIPAKTSDWQITPPGQG